MNPDLLADSRADFCFDSFDETHANPAKFIGWADGGGNCQRGLFHLAPAKVRSWIDAFECVRHFSCFHNLFFGSVADSFNDTTILSVALLLNGELSGRSLANIEQNHCFRRHLTQKHADFTRGDLAVFQFRHRFHSMFSRR
jgi:hypothetical protein